MNKSCTLPATKASQWEPKIPFDLVIAYEDCQTRDRAMLLYDRLAQQLADDYDFQCAWWKFDHLRETSLMEQAIDDAVDANMIILSLHAGKTLPRMANEWIQCWMPIKGGSKSALVTLLSLPHEPTNQSASLHALLQKVARRARMDFFLHSADLDAESDIYSIETIDQRAGTVTPVLENILHLPTSAMARAL